MLIQLAIKSLWARRMTFLLTVLSLCFSFLLIMAVEHIRSQAKEGFTRTISGTDLIVGARSNPINLLLYSVFRIGNATHNIHWQTYLNIAQLKHVDWAIPISLGDSHRGYRVIGTTDDYFKHFQFGYKQSLAFEYGRAFSGIYEAVIGAELAKKLNYTLNQKIILSHGIADTSFSDHRDKPFTIVGILQPTGTPVDQTVHVSLAGIEAIHLGWEHGSPQKNSLNNAADILTSDLTPTSITAIMLGLKSKIATFKMMRFINEYDKEPLTAILPGASLAKLWQLLNIFENILLSISLLVVATSFIGMLSTLLVSVKERTREMAILRALGFSPLKIIALIEIEIILMTIVSVVLSLMCFALGLIAFGPVLQDHFGILIQHNIFTTQTLHLTLVFLALSSLLALIPSLSVYRRSLSEGLAFK